jgi:ketosteroid isomerase-like protein
VLDGSTVTGLEAIREQWSGLLAMNGRITVRSRFAIEAGDLAILSNGWTLTVGDQSMSAVTAEVAQRQPDGDWLYLIDHPYASLEPDEMAALMAATASPGT